MRKFAQRLLKTGEFFDNELDGEGDVGGKFLVKDTAVTRRNQQLHPLIQIVRQRGHHRMRRNLLRARQNRQNRLDRIPVSPHQPARSQLGAAKIARHHHGHIAQPAALQNRQRRPARRARRLAIIVAVRRYRWAKTNDKGGDIMRSVAKFLFDTLDKCFGLVHAENGRGRSNEARIFHFDFGSRCGSGNRIAVAHDGYCNGRRPPLPKPRKIPRLSLFPNDQLTALACRMLGSVRYEELRLPFGALATELLTYHGALFTAGDLHATLLASAAIPGVFPPVDINGTLYVDGALTAYVPMAAAVQMGAASLVILDAGEPCHRREPPRHAAEMFTVTMQAAMRQRVRVEAKAIASDYPVLYLPTPCPISTSLLDFSKSALLMAQAADMAAAFLLGTAVPTPGNMSGAPHHHDDTPMRQLTRLVTA